MVHIKGDYNMDTKEKNRTIKLINIAWNKIKYCISANALGYMSDEYLKMNIQEERRHDNFRGTDIKRGLTITQAGKFFAVQQLVKYLTGSPGPYVKYYVNLRQSCFYAYSLAALYQDHLVKALEGIDLQAIIALDYVKLME
jgi:hypothetical protein